MSELRARRFPADPHRIFMSYRREETRWAAILLFDRLARCFGREQVFKDIDSINLGDDFVEKITNAVGSCDVFLALIGGRWLTITGQDERRRLDDPGDFVRLEIEAALKRGIRVIPILVDGASMPGADQLPENMAGLTRRQALKLSEDRFGSDFQRLHRAITTALEEARQEAEEAARPELALSATDIDLGRLPLHGQSPERRVRLRNAGGGDLNARAATTASWLKLRQTAGELVVTADTSAAGKYDGTINVESDGGTATITVHARIAPAPLPVQGPAIVPAPGHGPRKGLIAAGTTAAVALAAVAAFVFDGHQATTPSITGSLARTLSYANGSVAFSPNGSTLAVGDGGGSIFLWSLASHKITATLTDPRSSGLQSVAFSPDGAALAAGDNDGSTYLWSLASHKIAATLIDPGRHGVQSVAFSPNGATLAAGDFDGSTYLWSLASRKITATLTDPGSKGVDSVAFSPNGATLAAADGDDEADGDDRTYLWSLASRKITAVLTDPGGSSGAVYSVAFSPNGSTLAVGAADGNMYLWSLASRKITATFTDQSGSSGAVYSVAFSANGSTLAVGDEDGSTYLWSLASRKITATLTAPVGQASESQGVQSVAFSPNGTTLAAGDFDGSTYLWSIAYHKS